MTPSPDTPSGEGAVRQAAQDLLRAFEVEDGQVVALRSAEHDALFRAANGLSEALALSHPRPSPPGPDAGELREASGKVIRLGEMLLNDLDEDAAPEYGFCAVVQLDRSAPCTLKFGDVWESSPVKITTSAPLAALRTPEEGASRG